MACLTAIGFSCGIPLALTGSGGTFQAWMKSENIDLGVIGLFSLAGLPYSFKYLWSPIMDRYIPPFLGRRRGWMLVAQLALIATLCTMAFSSPAGSPKFIAVLAFLLAFFGASQDIVADAHRTEILRPEELGAGAGVFTMGYRIAMLVSGAIALMLADHMSWRFVYLIMAATLLVGVVMSFLAPEPILDEKPPRSLQEAIVLPFVEYFKRRGAAEMLIFTVLYKMDVVMTLLLTTPFMLEMGFSKTDIGAVTKAFGMIASIVGTLAGGALLAKLQIKRSLWIFGLLQGFSSFSFLMLARLGHHYPMMVTAITVENFFSGMGNAAFLAFLMSICDRRFTATQYALLSSLTAITRTIAGAPSGFLAKALGWEFYFLACMFCAIPGLLLLLRFDRWHQGHPASVSQET